MTGYDTHDGFRDEPFDNRDDDDPEYTIDPMFSGTHADGGEHRELRHETLENTPETPSDVAVYDPRSEVNQ